jgi:hypothetical protein
MFSIEKGSYQEAKINLQNVGLMVNEMKHQGKPITYEMYNDLLEFALNVIDKAADYDETMTELRGIFEEIPVRWDYET